MTLEASPLVINSQALLGSNPSTVKSHNLRAILLTLLRHQLVSRARLAEWTGLSSTTVTNVIAELLEQGIVAEEGTLKPNRPRGVGRPRTALRLVPDARFAIGVHIGVGNVRVAMTDLRAKPVFYRTLTHALDSSAETVIAETGKMVRQVLETSGVPQEHVVGIGVGASGLVDPRTGVNLIAPNLGWHEAPIRAWLARHVDLPVCVDNNVRAMALGEALFGAGQDVRVLAFVYARIGVGAGFVIDGQLYRGSGAGAGEIGHTTIIADGGEPCRCGNTGCLETLVSEPTIVHLAQQMARQNPDSILATRLQQVGDDHFLLDGVFEAARAGDPEALTLLRQRAHFMGIALANLVNVLNPELILLGGIFDQGRDLLLPATEATMRQRSFANLGDQVQLRPTSFGRQAGVIGAAALALNTFFYQRGEIPVAARMPESASL